MRDLVIEFEHKVFAEEVRCIQLGLAVPIPPSLPLETGDWHRDRMARCEHLIARLGTLRALIAPYL